MGGSGSGLIETVEMQIGTETGTVTEIGIGTETRAEIGKRKAEERTAETRWVVFLPGSLPVHGRGLTWE